MENRLEWLKVRLEYLFPVLTVLAFACILAIFYVLSSVEIQAVVVEEEGTSSQQASAGVLNALVYILPAIIGGFIIAMMFKYRKKVPLKAFFGMAIFMATTFISWLFINLIIFVLRLNSEGLVLIAPYSAFITTGETNVINMPILVEVTLPLSFFAGVLIAFVISSNRVIFSTKNHALLVLGGLMGAFLAMILPTWTVVFMLVLLSFYDIYSVRHGPIRDIMEYTYGPEQPAVPPPPPKSAPAPQAIPTGATGSRVQPPPPRPVPDIKVVSVKTEPKLVSAPESYPPDDDLLSNMTYSTAHWDLGIGDLVFYSLLGSHTLRYGIQYIPDFGIIAPLGLFAATTIGIIVGFGITLKLLQKNPMLPGLPMSIFLGLIGFGIGIGILNYI